VALALLCLVVPASGQGLADQVSRFLAFKTGVKEELGLARNLAEQHSRGADVESALVKLYGGIDPSDDVRLRRMLGLGTVLATRSDMGVVARMQDANADDMGRLLLLWNAKTTTDAERFAVDGLAPVSMTEMDLWKRKEDVVREISKAANDRTAAMALEFLDGDRQSIVDLNAEAVSGVLMMLTNGLVWNVIEDTPVVDDLFSLSRWRRVEAEGVLSERFAVLRAGAKPLATIHFLMNECVPFFNLAVVSASEPRIIMMFSLLNKDGTEFLDHLGEAGSELIAEAEAVREEAYRRLSGYWLCP
jgi:hypothetical protein